MYAEAQALGVSTEPPNRSMSPQSDFYLYKVVSFAIFSFFRPNHHFIALSLDGECVRCCMKLSRAPKAGFYPKIAL